MATPVGLDLLEAASSVEAGLTRFQESVWSDRGGFPLTLSAIPDSCLPPLETDARWSGDARLDRILSIARLVAPEVSSKGMPSPVRFFLGLPEVKRDPIDLDGFVRAMHEALGVSANVMSRGVMTSGRAAGLVAVLTAAEEIAGGTAEAALVAGADTLVDFGALSDIMEQSPGRVKSEVGMDSFIPGEGLALLLLMTEQLARQQKVDVPAWLWAGADGFEAGHLDSDEPYLGDGLSGTLRQLFGHGPPDLPRVRTVYSSMNGESHWSKEWGVAALRFASHLHEDLQLEHPADCLGDLGAAVGPCMMCLAATRMGSIDSASPVLVYASSDRGERAAVLMGAEPRNCGIRRI